MNSAIVVRKKLRAVLVRYVRRRLPEKLLFELLEPEVPEALTHDEFKEALEWNHINGFVEYRTRPRGDDHEGLVEWFLTDTGKQKEGL